MDTTVAAAIAAGVGLVSALIVALVNRTPYSALADRVVALERKVSELELELARGRTVREKLRARIEYLHAWIKTNAGDVMPQPDPPPMDLLQDV